MMALDPDSIGKQTDPQIVEWTDRDTLLYAIGLGCGMQDLQFTTENSHGIDQQVLPTFAVIACPSWGAAELVGSFDMSKLLHGSQGIRLYSPLPTAGRLSVVCEIADIQDKGAGKNAVIAFKSVGTEPSTGRTVVESVTTAVIRGAGGFGGNPGVASGVHDFPVHAPDARVMRITREDQALIYRLSGDRNPLHSDPWFAGKAGFAAPILHGLCTYGIAGLALVSELGAGDASRVTAIDARFTSPVYPGEVLVTSIWRTEKGRAVFQTEASRPDGANARVVLNQGIAEYED